MCNLDLNFGILRDYHDKHLQVKVAEDITRIEQKFHGIHTDFKQLAADRNVSSLTQFIELFKRNLQYLVRNPRGLKGVFFNGVFSGLLQLALYWHIGDAGQVDLKDSAQYF